MQAVDMDLFVAGGGNYLPGDGGSSFKLPMGTPLDHYHLSRCHPGHQEMVRVLWPPQIHPLGCRPAIPRQGIQDALPVRFPPPFLYMYGKPPLPGSLQILASKVSSPLFICMENFLRQGV